MTNPTILPSPLPSCQRDGVKISDIVSKTNARGHPPLESQSGCLSSNLFIPSLFHEDNSCIDLSHLSRLSIHIRPPPSFDISSDSSLQLWHFTKNPSLARCSALSDAESPAGESLEHRELSIHPVAKGCTERKIKNIFIPDTQRPLLFRQSVPRSPWRFDFGKEREKRVHTRVFESSKPVRGSLSENIESFLFISLDRF